MRWLEVAQLGSGWAEISLVDLTPKAQDFPSTSLPTEVWSMSCDPWGSEPFGELVKMRAS